MSLCTCSHVTWKSETPTPWFSAPWLNILLWRGLILSVSVWGFGKSWIIIISKLWSAFFSSVSIPCEYLLSVLLSSPALNPFFLAAIQRYFLNTVLQELEAPIKSWFIVSTQMPRSWIERREALRRNILASWVSPCRIYDYCTLPNLRTTVHSGPAHDFCIQHRDVDD